MLQGRSAFAGPRSGQLSNGSSQNLLRLLRVLIQGGDNLRCRDRFMLRVPAVVIGDHGDRRVAKLRFARQFRLRHVGHADYFEVKLPVCLGFRQGGKLRPFDANVCSAAMDHDGFMNACIRQNALQLSASRMRKRNVSDNSLSEKSGDAVLRAVEKLVSDEKFSWP